MQVIISDQETDDLEELGPLLNEFLDNIVNFGNVVAGHQAEQRKILQTNSTAFTEQTATKLNVFRRTAPYSKEARAFRKLYRVPHKMAWLHN